MYPRRIKIYLLTFSNGKQYAGQTRARLKERLWRHQNQPINSELKKLLDEEKPKIEITSSHFKQSAADAAEKKMIRKLTNPINKLGVVGNKFTGGKEPVYKARKAGMFANRAPYDRSRSDRPAWCCGCQKQRPARFFTATERVQAGFVRRAWTAGKLRSDVLPADCGWCREKKPASDFPSDRSRSSGLASICRICHKASNAARNAAIKNGKSTSEAYNRVKQSIIANRATQ